MTCREQNQGRFSW